MTEPNVLTHPKITANPNRETIAGLIAAAAWLSQNPELPYAHAVLYLGQFDNDYQQMKQLAEVMAHDLPGVEEAAGVVSTALISHINDRVEVQAGMMVPAQQPRFVAGRSKPQVLKAARRSKAVDLPVSVQDFRDPGVVRRGAA